MTGDEEEKPSITAVFLALGGEEPRRATGWVKVRCVLHEERNASATINEDAGRYNCFYGCVERPVDAYELVGLKEGLEDFNAQKRRAWELAAGQGSRPVRRESDEGGPRLLGRTRDQRDRRAYRPAWRVP